MSLASGYPKNLDAYKGARCLVLGAGGFVGRWVAARLSALGAELQLVVRDRDAAEAVFARWQVAGAVHQVDLANPGSAKALVELHKPQAVFNLTGYGVDKQERDERKAWRINFDLVHELCLALAAAKDPAWHGAHLVHAGSAAEYGSAKGQLDEDTPPEPTSAYGRTKLLGTLELAVRGDLVGIRAVAARLFTVYGPGEHTDRLLPLLLEAAAKEQPIELTAGLNKRDFTYVEDVAEGLLRLGLARLDESQVVNLATGKLATVRAFAMSAAGVLGMPLEHLLFGAKPTPKDEFEHGDVAVERLRMLTGWVPAIAIPAGVERTRDFWARKV